MKMPGSKVQKAVRACTIKLLNLEPAKHEVQNIQWMFALHRPKRSVDSSDLRSKSADFECLQVLCSEAIRRHMKIATHPRSIIHEFQQMELT